MCNCIPQYAEHAMIGACRRNPLLEFHLRSPPGTDGFGGRQDYITFDGGGEFYTFTHRNTGIFHRVLPGGVPRGIYRMTNSFGFGSNPPVTLWLVEHPDDQVEGSTSPIFQLAVIPSSTVPDGMEFEIPQGGVYGVKATMDSTEEEWRFIVEFISISGITIPRGNNL